jgi:Ca-activated chloride channel family protein
MIVGFLYPSYLLLLFLLPILFFTHFISLRAHKYKSFAFANFDAIARIKGVDFYSRNYVTVFWAVLVVVLLVFSLSGMFVQMTLKASDFSFVIAVDSSMSMEANDVFPSRFEAAKESALEFVDSLGPGARTGLISFSGNAFIEQKVTDDKLVIKNSIKQIPLSSLGGTDIDEAVFTGVNLLVVEENRAMVVLSDGQLNVGVLDDAIEYANLQEVVIHTIGIGTDRGGATSFGISKLDEDSLKALAYNTNGKYFRVEDTRELENAFDEILELKEHSVNVNLQKYLLVVAIILFVFGFLLVNTRYKVFP